MSDPIDVMRERFRAASVEQAGQARRARRRPARVGAAILAVLGVSGGLAIASGLIDIGEPTPSAGGGPAYKPAGERELVLTASADGRQFGVAIYTANNGDDCAIGGQVVNGEIGLFAGETFRPYAEDHAGACIDLGKHPLVNGQAELGAVRMVYGRAAPDVRRVVVVAGGERYPVRPRQGGAYLLLYEAAAPPPQRVIPLTQLR